jgi:hypothetical protein
VRYRVTRARAISSADRIRESPAEAAWRVPGMAPVVLSVVGPVVDAKGGAWLAVVPSFDREHASFRAATETNAEQECHFSLLAQPGAGILFLWVTF